MASERAQEVTTARYERCADCEDGSCRRCGPASSENAAPGIKLVVRRVRFVRCSCLGLGCPLCGRNAHPQADAGVTVEPVSEHVPKRWVPSMHKRGSDGAACGIPAPSDRITDNDDEVTCTKCEGRTAKTIPRIEILPPTSGQLKARFGPQTIATLEERIQQDAMATRAHVADWTKVDLRGDLLYVGSSTRLVQRLSPLSHIMWTLVHAHPEFPRVRIAVWALAAPLDAIECWMTETCRPLWSGHRGSADEWRWRDPDCVLSPDAFHPERWKAPPFSSSTAGVYAWILGDKPREIMLGGATDRELRRVQDTPAVYHCHGPGCYYKWLMKPDDATVCPRCGRMYGRTTKAARAAVSRAFDTDEET